MEVSDNEELRQLISRVMLIPHAVIVQDSEIPRRRRHDFHCRCTPVFDHRAQGLVSPAHLDRLPSFDVHGQRSAREVPQGL